MLTYIPSPRTWAPTMLQVPPSHLSLLGPLMAGSTLKAELGEMS